MTTQEIKTTFKRFPPELNCDEVLVREDFLTKLSLPLYVNQKLPSKRKAKEFLSIITPTHYQTELGDVYGKEDVNDNIKWFLTRYNRAHFPVGTIVRIPINSKDDPIYTVTGITCNGPDSWLIRTDRYNTITQLYDGFHISHVREIIKRGDGTLIPTRNNHTDDYYEKTSIDLKRHYGKSKKQYVAYTPSGLVLRLIDTHPRYHQLQMDHLYDIEKIVAEVKKSGIIQYIRGIYFTYTVVSKKKIHQRLPKIMAKCRINREKAQKEYDLDMEANFCMDGYDSDEAFYD